jgi:hypothetical protein
LNSQAYHGGKTVSAVVFMPNHHFGPEGHKKIARMIVGEIGGTIEASFNDMLIVKTPGDKGSTFYIKFITGAPKIVRSQAHSGVAHLRLLAINPLLLCQYYVVVLRLSRQIVVCFYQWKAVVINVHFVTSVELHWHAK